MVQDERARVVMVLFISRLVVAIITASDIYRSYLGSIKEKEDGLLCLLDELRASKSKLEKINRRLNDIIGFILDPTLVIGEDKKSSHGKERVEL